ncbi:MAG: hypothetical protein ING84_11575 [Cytophagales bacterium]|nr:hypothetical protein [Cytophagales bacterium]MCA6366352.1 hypothetical protein [Cytophagales bacterium]MCA6371151.1 hypothetical protein [Cytophagales bacterium]MCA6374724.1 hypothetical protein [Cytophagales bacterium]MCA6384593.1 hypothetical protein [Cytophagales bacterium]
MKNNRLVIILISVGILLFIPLIAMQFTEEVKWTFFDFIAMGTLLLITGVILEVVLRKVTQTKYRILFCVLVIGAFLLIWAELAVGIFGTPLAGH